MSGSEILLQFKRIMARKEGVPAWSDTMTLALNKNGNRFHFNFRTYDKVKSLASTLAQIDGEKNIQLKNVTEACELQRFKDLESLI